MKKTIRFYFSMFAGKVIYRIQRMVGSNGSSFPGGVAIRLCPDFLGQIEKPETVVVVTGTNGKSTTCKFIYDILEDQGQDVICNKLGTNINNGIASALLSSSTYAGKPKKKIAVLELDERSALRVNPFIKPDYLLCTNLFRDTIRRSAHAEYIADLLTESLPESTKLILNADDLISGNLAPDNERIYYGIDRMPEDTTECRNVVNDIQICPKCHAPLKYEYRRYHHIGKAYCEKCGFVSPAAFYHADVDLENRKMSMYEGEAKTEYVLPNDSIFNAYNLVGAIALLRELKMPETQIQVSVEKLAMAASRYSSTKAGNVEIITNMAKGQTAVACSCVFDYIQKTPGKKEIILLLDDVHDKQKSSENMTWIYDTDFEFLNDPDITNIVVGGVRAIDYKLRLLIAGVPEEKIQIAGTENETAGYLHYDADKIYILHEVYQESAAMQVRENVMKKIAEKKEGV